MSAGVRIVLVSDTHGFVPAAAVPEGDVLVHAGDFTNDGSPEQVAAFGRWLEAMPHEHVIVVPGNHDFLFEHEPARARSLLPDGVHVLVDRAMSACGLRIYGAPWQPRFHDWAFNLDRGEQLRRKWDLIPSGLDVLITHGPPAGTLDHVTRAGHVGCADLAVAVERARPRIHVFGHVHESYGETTLPSGVRCYNAALCENDGAWHGRAPLVLTE